MRVTTVSVNVRYSKQIGDGSFKTVELGTEGSLDSSDEDWQEVQSVLYRQLGDQMRYVFNGNSSGKAQNGSLKAVAPLPTPPLPSSPAPREHWCQEHQREYKRYEKDGRTWYSHKQGNNWCKE